MLEQQTIQQGMDFGKWMLETFGPVVTLAIIYVVHQIFQGRSLNNKAIKPADSNSKEIDKLRDRYGVIKDEMQADREDYKERILVSEKALASRINEVEKDLKDRITYEWAKKQLLL